MKNSRSSVTGTLRTRPIPARKLRPILLIGLGLCLPHVSFGQLNELAQELQQGERDLARIADIVISAVKTIAGVSVVLGGLVFLYLRDQQSDLTKRVGHVILGLAIFWILLSVGDSIRS